MFGNEQDSLEIEETVRVNNFLITGGHSNAR